MSVASPLQRRREFHQHLFVYALVNGGLWAAWIGVGIVDGFGFVYPIFPTVFWGIGVAVHGVTAYRPSKTDPAATEGDLPRGGA